MEDSNKIEETSIEAVSGVEKHPLEETDSFEEHMQKDIEGSIKFEEATDVVKRREFVDSLKAEGSERIRQIGEALLSESDIMAKHGTSIENAMSILETGFNYHRTSMVVQKNDSIAGLCAYGWKENAGGDAANVILSVPKVFFKDLFGWDEQSYNSWINSIKEQEEQEFVINSMSDIEFGMAGFFKATLPKEFIRGAFVYTDGKNYLSFMNDTEEALDHLAYIDNPRFYENLSPEEKEKFLSKIRETKFRKDQE